MAASFRDAVWLARDELGRGWKSLLVTGVATLFVGMIWAVMFDGAHSVVARGEAAFSFPADIFFLFLAPYLTLNWMSRPYWAPWRDPFTPELSFLRSLPLPVGEIVKSRVLRMCANLLLLSPLFFLPAYLLPLSLRQEATPLEYLGFVLFWGGYVLLFAGVMLYTELMMSGTKMFLVQGVAFAGVLVAVVVLSAGFLEGGVLLGVLRLVQAYGPALPAASLLLGAAGFWVGARVTGRRLARRDLSA